MLRHADRRRRRASRGALRDGRHRDRPRADADRDAAPARRRRQVRRVLRRRPLGALAGRPRDALEHVAGVRRDRRDSSRSTTRRCATCARPAAATRVRARRGATARRRACSARDGDPTPTFTELLELDLDGVEPSLAGPRRPQDRVPLADVPGELHDAAYRPARRAARDPADGTRRPCRATAHVVIAAITSCTNTSNPSVMVAAGPARAQRRRARPASRSRTSRRASRPARASSPTTSRGRPHGAARRAGLQPRRLRLHDLHRQLRPAAPTRSPQAVRETTWRSCAVLSGNRNFEGRIHPLVRASYLASPPLVVAYALAGRISIDLEHEPLGTDGDGSRSTCATLADARGGARRRSRPASTPELFEREYAHDLGRRRALAARCRRRRARSSPGTPTRPTCASRRSSRICSREPEPLDRHRRRALPGRARRLGHDRPHLAGRLDPARHAGRALPDRARRRAARLQLVRRAPRQPRGHGARHVRQHPPAQRARATAARAASRRTCRPASSSRSSTPPSATAPRTCRWSCSPARSTAPARPATGPPRARCCWASAP